MGFSARNALALLCCSLAGCLVDVDYSGTQYECAQGHICPPGFTCGANGRCVPNGGNPDAPTGGTGGGGAGGMAGTGGMGGSGGMGGTGGMAGTGGTGGTCSVVPSGCGKSTILSDNFDDGVTAAFWDYAYGAAMRAETGGELVITLPDNTTSYSGYQSGTTVDVTGDRVFVEVNQVASTSTNAQTYLQLTGPTNRDQLIILQENGTLYFQTRSGGPATNVGSVLYDPVARKWWQIREAGGTIFFETSADGCNWTQGATAPTPSWANYAMVEIGAGAYMAQTGNGSAHFDNFNGGAPTTGAWCGASALVDNFNDGVRGPQWQRSYQSTACALSEANGYAVMTPNGSVGECAYQSSTAFDLRGDSVDTYAFQLIRETATQSYTFLSVVALNGDDVNITESASTLEAQQRIGNVSTTLGSIPYNGSTDAWWRIRENNGNLFFETSPDGATWTQLAMTPEPFVPSAVSVIIGGGLSGGLANPGIARFNNVNGTP